MKKFLPLIICLIALPVVTQCQERTAKNMAGPFGDGQFRVAVTFMSAAEGGYKVQSLIVTTNQVKKKAEMPTEYVADLTTTTRSLETGAKDQKIFVIRWGKSEDVEVKCEGGKWSKLAPDPELSAIVETVKAVVRESPRDAKRPSDFTLPAELEQKVISHLDGLQTSKLQCVRTGS